MLTREELDELVIPDAEFAEFLSKTPMPAISWEQIETMRTFAAASVEEMKTTLSSVPAGLEQFTRLVPMRDGHQAETWIVRPTNRPGGPLIVLIHGGGFVMGDSVQHVALARPLADLFGAVVVSAQYRLAPEAPWPTQPHDCHDTLRWAAAQAGELGADPAAKGFIVGGTSAGGNLSAVCAQLAADEGLQPPLTGLWQNITFLFDHSTIPERYRELWIARTQKETEDVIILNSKDFPHVERIIGPDYHSPLFSPTNSKTAHRGIPRTFFQANGLDPLRDDALVYQDMLRENGVETRFVMYPGLPHAFHAVLPMLESNKRWRLDFVKGFAWLLKADVSDEQIQEVTDKHVQIGGD